MAALTQEQQAGLGQYTQDQIANAVQQMKISDKRKRNEMIRLGTSDPSAFALQATPQLQQAVQPSTETRFAGDILNDSSEELPFGYTTQDIGLGKYNILDQAGSIKGTGYKSVADAYREYAKAPYEKGITVDKYGNLDAKNQLEELASFYASMGAPTPTVGNLNNLNFGIDSPISKQAQAISSLSSIDEFGNPRPISKTDYDKYVEAEISKSINSPWKARPLSEWELLGRELAKVDPSIASGKLDINCLLSGVKHGGLPSDEITEKISGLNTLFGSKPIFKDGEIVGYKSNFTPNVDSSYVAGKGRYDTTPTSAAASYGSKSRAFQNAIWRDFAEGDWTGVRNLNSLGDVFINKAGAENVPGWLNKSAYEYKDFAGENRGLRKAIEKAEDFGTSMAAGGLFGKELKNFARENNVYGPIRTILSIIPGPWQPAMAAINAAYSLANNNPLGALGSLFSFGNQITGTNPMAGALSKIADKTGLSVSTLSNIMKGIGSFAGSKFSGKSTKESLLGALVSTAPGALSSIFNVAPTNPMSNVANSMVSQGLTQLYNKNQEEKRNEPWRNSNKVKQ